MKQGANKNRTQKVQPGSKGKAAPQKASIPPIQKKVAKAGAPSLSRFLVQVSFFFASILLLAVYFSIDANKNWLTQRIAYYWTEFTDERDQPDLEYRKANRLGPPYVVSKLIGDNLKKMEDFKNVVLLMPPSDYLKSKGLEYHVPEPAVFYYYTGVKTVWTDSKEVYKANYYFDFENGKMFLEKLRDSTQTSEVLARFHNYKPSL